MQIQMLEGIGRTYECWLKAGCSFEAVFVHPQEAGPLQRGKRLLLQTLHHLRSERRDLVVLCCSFACPCCLRASRDHTCDIAPLLRGVGIGRDFLSFRAFFQKLMKIDQVYMPPLAASADEYTGLTCVVHRRTTPRRWLPFFWSTHPCCSRLSGPLCRRGLTPPPKRRSGGRVPLARAGSARQQGRSRRCVHRS